MDELIFMSLFAITIIGLTTTAFMINIVLGVVVVIATIAFWITYFGIILDERR